MLGPMLEISNGNNANTLTLRHLMSLSSTSLEEFCQSSQLVLDYRKVEWIQSNHQRMSMESSFWLQGENLSRPC